MKVTASTMLGMDASTARTSNMRRFVAEAGGPADWSNRYSPLKDDGTPRWAPAQVSQWISEADPKGIGHRLARAIEHAMGLPSGILDSPPDQSHSAGLDWTKVYLALDFLDDLFSAKGKAFDRHRYKNLLAAVYKDLSEPAPPSVVQLTVKYGGCVDAEQDWRPDSAAGAG